MRSRSATGAANSAVKWEKSKWWQASQHAGWGNWPWWMWHASEIVYWAEGNYDGAFWKEARAQYTDEENREYDKGWIALYGRAAFFKSIAKVYGPEEADRLRLKFPAEDGEEEALN